VSGLPPVEVTVYPYECDAYGHLNEAAFVQLFERARWDALALGPGRDLFQRHGVWPAVRHAVVDYHLPAFPGDVLRVEAEVAKVGRTSLTLHQRARRAAGGALLAELQIVVVLIDREGKATPLPEEIAAAFGARASARPGDLVRLDVGGVTLALDSRGDGPALLLLHGFPLDRTMWAHQVATLARWRRIAPDFRGAGASDAPDGDYSIAVYADDVARLLDRLHVERAVVAGLSMGGYVAFEMWRRHRDRILGLILADTRADADSPDARRRREDMIAAARSGGAPAIAERMVPQLLGRSTRQAQPLVVEQVREMIVGASVPGLVGTIGAIRDRPDSTALLASIDVPTLVIVGEEDEATPPALSRAMAAAIPGAAITVIPGAGHVSPLEAPTLVTRVMAAFLEAVPRP
jgi:YbgC/YbaW family acyl-CoA thioester hydrolase